MDETEDTDEYLLQYATIIAREINVCPIVFYILSQLNSDYYSITIGALQKLRAVYYKYAPWVSRSYHRSLFNCPIKYTGSCIRTVPIPNMMGARGGVRFLDSDPPLFDERFLQNRTPALTGISILTNNPIEFYYRIGIQDVGTITSGRIVRSDYVELPPRKFARNVEFLPGRYFLDLNLIFDINPLLIYGQTGQVILTTAYSLIWYDRGDHLEPILQPNINIIIEHFTHFILRFKTVPTQMIDPVRIGVNLHKLNPRLYSFVIDYNRKACVRKKINYTMPVYDRTPADILLCSDEETADGKKYYDDTADGKKYYDTYSAGDSSSE